MNQNGIIIKDIYESSIYNPLRYYREYKQKLKDFISEGEKNWYRKNGFTDGWEDWKKDIENDVEKYKKQADKDIKILMENIEKIEEKTVEEVKKFLKKRKNINEFYNANGEFRNVVNYIYVTGNNKMILLTYIKDCLHTNDYNISVWDIKVYECDYDKTLLNR